MKQYDVDEKVAGVRERRQRQEEASQATPQGLRVRGEGLRARLTE